MDDENGEGVVRGIRVEKRRKEGGGREDGRDITYDKMKEEKR